MSDETNTEDNDKSNEINDVAERLTILMRRITNTANNLKFKHPNNPNHTITGMNKPLYEVFEPIAEELGFSNYAQLRDNFVALCNRVIRDVESLSLKRPTTQERWIKAAETANDVFNASNFSDNCSTVFGRHFSDEVYERLEDASERLQDVGRKEASSDQLTEALDAARSVMEAYEKNGNISPELNKILKHYLQQIEGAYQRYEDFGEEVFWSTYKELFATFLQVHPAIMPKDKSDDAKEAVKTAMNNMGGKMQYGLRALSATADIATITTAGAALLKIAAM